MKQKRVYPIVTITPKAERSLRNGHPWVYGEEIRTRQGEPLNGELVDVCSQNGTYLGTGFYNDNSKITVRLLSRNANDRFDAAFWLRRVEYAVAYRRTVMPGPDFQCCRLIHGEADQFPGLTVERYNDLLVTETLSLGMERVKPLIFDALYQVLTAQGETISGIYERNESAIRRLEGMDTGKGWYPLEGAPIPKRPYTEITENGIVYGAVV